MSNTVHLRCYLFFVGSKFCTWMYLCCDGKEAIEQPFERGIYILTFMVDFYLCVRMNSNLHSLTDRH